MNLHNDDYFGFNINDAAQELSDEESLCLGLITQKEADSNNKLRNKNYERCRKRQDRQQYEALKKVFEK